MKKQFALVGVIAVMGLGAFLVSCNEDDFRGCTCTSNGQTHTVSAEQMRADGFDNCRAAEAALKVLYGATTCKDI